MAQIIDLLHRRLTEIQTIAAFEVDRDCRDGEADTVTSGEGPMG